MDKQIMGSCGTIQSHFYRWGVYEKKENSIVKFSGEFHLPPIIYSQFAEKMPELVQLLVNVLSNNKGWKFYEF